MEDIENKNKISSNKASSVKNELIAETCSTNEMTKKNDNFENKKDKRREKRPEIARYQPPSSRTSKSSSTPTVENSNKPTTSSVKNTDTPVQQSANSKQNLSEKTEPQNLQSKVNASNQKQNLEENNQHSQDKSSTKNEKQNLSEKKETQREFKPNEKQKYLEKAPSPQLKSNSARIDQPSVSNHSNESKRTTKSNRQDKSNKTYDDESRQEKHDKRQIQENNIHYKEAGNISKSRPEAKFTPKDNVLFDSSSKTHLKVKNSTEKNEKTSSASTTKPSGGGGGGGGLIKLNQNALNEMIANHERMSRFNNLNETEDYQLSRNKIIENSNDNYHDHESRNLNGNADIHLNQKGQHYKKLFDPNNPNKPIFMPDKSSEEPILNKKNFSVNIKKDGSNSMEYLKNAPPNKSEIIKVNNILSSINPLESRLKHLVDTFDCSKMFSTHINEINSLRSQLECLCSEAMFTHIETAYNSNVDINHWRSCYHQIIELLRKELQNVTFNQQQQTHIKLKEQISKQISAYIDEGHLFFSNLIKNLEEKYLKFSIQHFIDLNYFERLINQRLTQSDTTIKSKDIKIALICANRCLISMGDLCRYKEMIFNTSSMLAVSSLLNTHENQSSTNKNDFNTKYDSNNQRDYSTARSFYLKAMAVAPKSSRSYHQLAILAVYTKRRLDTCYYYFRCSEVSSPLTSVRQALNSLFEEARIRSDAIMKMISAAILNKKNKKLNSLLNSSEQNASRVKTNQNRKEIWFKAPLSNPSSSNSLGKKTNNTFSIEETSKKSNAEINSDNSEKYSDDSDNNSDDENSDEDEVDTDEDDQDDNEDDEEIKSEKFSLSCLNEKRLSVYELNKRFMLNYLNTIGKIFTKVGMESYPEVCSRMLHEFKELLRRKPNPFGRLRLLQITIINISLIDLTFKSSMDNNTNIQLGVIRRSQQLECALSCAIDMFVLISKRFSYLLKRSKLLENDIERENDDATDEISSNMSDDFDEWRQMYPSIKIFIDWMLCNANMWQPMPDQLPPDLGPNPDRWKIMSNMFNLVQKLSTRLEILFEKKVDVNSKDLIMKFLSRVKLEEDLEVAGFVPLLSLSPRADYDFQNKYNTIELNMFLNETNLSLELIELAKMKKRSEKLCLFADYLCGLEQPILKYDVLNKCYSQILGSQVLLSSAANFEFNRLNQIKKESNRTISTCSSSSLKSETDLMNIESSLMNSMVKSSLNDESESTSNEQSLLNDLKEKRRLLKVKMQEQQKREISHQSIIESVTQRQLELEIRPKFIVPDTNCFIDHLNLIDRILSTAYYIVVVPLLVINELDKLSKSIANCNDDSIEHAEYVKSNANQAIRYLNEKFDKRERNLKALTSQGSVLETIQFRSEEVRKQGTTDELILGCCLHYCRDNARDFMPNNKTDAIRLFREVVLLTEDRHLRLKAHTRNVPVKNIIQFCKWSNLYSAKNKNYFVKTSNLPKNSSFNQANRNKKKI